MMREFARRLNQNYQDYVTIEPEAFEVLEVRTIWPQPKKAKDAPVQLLMFPEAIRIIIKTSISKDIDFRVGHVVVDIGKLRSLARNLLRELRSRSAEWDKELRKAYR